MSFDQAYYERMRLAIMRAIADTSETEINGEPVRFMQTAEIGAACLDVAAFFTSQGASVETERGLRQTVDAMGNRLKSNIRAFRDNDTMMALGGRA